jgi:hypothetical protein
VAILPGDVLRPPDHLIPTNLVEAADWLATAADNSEKNFPGAYSAEFTRGFRCAAGWVKSWADRT